MISYNPNAKDSSADLDAMLTKKNLESFLKRMDGQLLKNDLHLDNGETFDKKWEHGAQAFDESHEEEFYNMVVK